MYSQRFTLLLALAATLGSTATAQAQIGVYNRPLVNPRPTVSPYLSIFRGNPAVNYFTIVRPQMETARQLAQLEQQFQMGQPNLMLPIDPQQTGGPLALTTGHPTSFQNTSHYFGNRGGGGGGVAGGVGNPTGVPNLNQAPLRTYFPGTVLQ